MKDNMKELSLNEMEQAGGGYIFVVFEGSPYFAPEIKMYRYEVIDDKTGNVLAFFDKPMPAEYYAACNGLSTSEIDWDTLEKLRKDAGTI